jgi:hypothetical protein
MESEAYRSEHATASRPNVRGEARPNGGPPGPGHRKCTPYLWPGPGGPPLGLASTEGLGLAATKPQLQDPYRRPCDDLPLGEITVRVQNHGLDRKGVVRHGSDCLAHLG